LSKTRGTLAGSTQIFAAYRKKFSVRPPDLSRMKFEDELRQITLAEGLQSLTAAPNEGAKIGAAPTKARESEDTKYLWVISAEDVPLALERNNAVKLQRGYLSHTNLTGGADAHSGGELWFTDVSVLILNGGSGRYPPQTEAELEQAALAFKAMGYKVANMGWDSGTDSPVRYLRG
jgi:hypothetical protein